MRNIEWHRRWHAIKTIGSFELRESIIERDNSKCRKCNLSRNDHKKIYNCDITIDHIDGNGRNSDKPNNEPSNLMTLCLKCHGSKDGKRADYSKRRSLKGKNHPNYKINDDSLKLILSMKKSGKKCKEISEKLNISLSSVYRLINKGL